MFLRKLIFLDFAAFPKDIRVPFPKDFSSCVRVRDARVVILLYYLLLVSLVVHTSYVLSRYRRSQGSRLRLWYSVSSKYPLWYSEHNRY